MECRTHVKELGIEGDLPLPTLLGSKEKDAVGVVVEKRGREFAQNVVRLFRKPGVWNLDRCRRHVVVLHLLKITYQEQH